MSSKTGIISRKLIAIIIASMIMMAIAIAAVIGISGYANLESITRSNIERSIEIIAKQINNLNENAEVAIKEITKNPEVSEHLILQSTLGPYYYEEKQEHSNIEVADQIYALQSQLELAGLLRQISSRLSLSGISLYHNDVFSLSPKAPSILMTLHGDEAGLAQYSKKDNSSVKYSTLKTNNFLGYADLFDISSIYDLTLEDFLKKIQASDAVQVIEYLDDEYSNVVNRLVVANNLLSIHSSSGLNISIPNPINWTMEDAAAFTVVVEQKIGIEKLNKLKEVLDVEVLLLIDGEVVVGTIKSDDELTYEGQGLINFGEDYFSVTKKLSFANNSGGLQELEIIVLSPVETVKQLNQQLFIQVLMIIVCFTLMMSTMYYFLIARVINDPLSKLTLGIESMAQGELIHEIRINSKDEMGQLARAFNEMSADVHEKNLQLSASHGELRELLEKQSKELEATQMQLIESEKMSSLGELVAGVSHEVSTPIGICITAESFFMDETTVIQKKYEEGSMVKKDFVEYIELAIDNSQILSGNLSRTAELIKNFKQVAVDQCIEDLRSFEVVKYVNDLLTTLKPRIKTLKHEIIVTGDSKVLVTSLPGALAQIITNLIMNSIIHGFDDIEKGHILIEIKEVQDGVRICYRDDGKGMMTESLNKIFDPFFTTRKGKGGTGLGMNIVYKLITDTLQGSIECKSEIDKGVQFDIFIQNQEL